MNVSKPPSVRGGKSRLRFPRGLSARHTKGQGKSGGAGVDGQSIAEFEGDLKENLYKLWNRMSSGSYFPPPVSAVEIPKEEARACAFSGCPRFPTGSLRRRRPYLEPEVEPLFHPDSYGYRPGRSAHDAMATCRQRCWKKDWVIDLDIRSFFDSLDHDLVIGQCLSTRISDGFCSMWNGGSKLRCNGRRHLGCKGSWDPARFCDLPLLANIFLHYVFDGWMAGKFPTVGSNATRPRWFTARPNPRQNM